MRNNLLLRAWFSWANSKKKLLVTAENKTGSSRGQCSCIGVSSIRAAEYYYWKKNKEEAFLDGKDVDALLSTDLSKSLIYHLCPPWQTDGLSSHLSSMFLKHLLSPLCDILSLPQVSPSKFYSWKTFAVDWIYRHLAGSPWNLEWIFMILRFLVTPRSQSFF